MIHRFPGFEIKTTKHRRGTILEVIGEPISFKCSISNCHSARNRRQLLLTIYRLIMPHLDFIKRSTIHHDHHTTPPDIFRKDEFHQLSIKQGIDLSNENNKIGYLIRGIRTKQLKTQIEFAAELSIHPTYLSKIEKGIHPPGRALLKKIMKLNSCG